MKTSVIIIALLTTMGLTACSESAKNSSSAQEEGIVAKVKHAVAPATFEDKVMESVNKEMAGYDSRCAGGDIASEQTCYEYRVRDVMDRFTKSIFANGGVKGRTAAWDAEKDANIGYGSKVKKCIAEAESHQGQMRENLVCTVFMNTYYQMHIARLRSGEWAKVEAQISKSSKTTQEAVAAAKNMPDSLTEEQKKLLANVKQGDNSKFEGD